MLFLRENCSIGIFYIRNEQVEELVIHATQANHLALLDRQRRGHRRRNVGHAFRSVEPVGHERRRAVVAFVDVDERIMLTILEYVA